jgi:tol-pal system protein YbgF
MRNLILRLTAAAFFFGLIVQPHAFAVSKEMIQLQTQVQQLQDALQHLQTSNDERMGVLVNLVQQNTDSVNKMTALINSLSSQLKTESDSSGSRNTQLSTQVQGLNDSVDELKTRIANLATQLQSIQGQMQNVNGTSPPMTMQPGSAMPQGTPAQGPPSPQGGGQAALAPPGSQAPPLDQLYQSGVRDYNSAQYTVSASEFEDVLRYYPQDPLAGNAQFFLGEIAYRQGKYQDAVKSYDTVLERYSGNTKAPAAELRKGQSLLKLGEKDAGVRELRTLVQRYPQTPEAQEGRSTLNGLGVRMTAAKPSAYPQPQ